MGGGCIQLVAYGAQDIYLTGQPQITFWKSVYKRYTNFALESILLVPDDSPSLNNRIVIPITRNADLLKRLWIQINPQLLYPISLSTVQLTTICNDFCHSFFKQFQIQIGGQIIDRIYGVWLSIWRDLTENNPYGSTGSIDTNGRRDTLQSTSNYNRMAYTNSGISVSTPGTYDPDNSSNYLSLSLSDTECYVPLPFWFCKNPGLALPLIALQYHDVKLVVDFSDFTNIATSNVINGQAFNVSESLQFYGDYVYLDSVERRQFATSTHEYLIEQLQKKNSKNQNTIKLSFKGVVKEIIIVGAPNNPFQISTYTPGNYELITNNTVAFMLVDVAQFTYATPLPGYPGFENLSSYNKPWIYSCNGVSTPNPIVVSNNSYLYSFANYNNELNDNISRTNVTLKLVLSGKEQMTARNLKYYTRKTVWESHTGIGSGNWGNIAVIPFSLHPEEYQPSGGVNFDIFLDARLVFENFDLTINEQLNPLEIYAVSYNILKITSGMGGVVYSN
jgi:Major capsid protein N-terminus/Large eukaryotic DNA virus major capsid protein